MFPNSKSIEYPDWREKLFLEIQKYQTKVANDQKTIEKDPFKIEQRKLLKSNIRKIIYGSLLGVIDSSKYTPELKSTLSMISCFIEQSYYNQYFAQNYSTYNSYIKIIVDNADKICPLLFSGMKLNYFCSKDPNTFIPLEVEFKEDDRDDTIEQKIKYVLDFTRKLFPTSDIQCSVCGGREVDVKFEQRRGLDEPMDVRFTCMNIKCRNKWVHK